MWIKKSFGVLVALMVVLAACSSNNNTGGSTNPSASGSTAASASQVALDPNQVLHVDMGGEPPTQDPTQATDSQSITVLRNTTATLVYFDKDLNVIPWLASSWDISPDGQTITFHLRDNIKYSNGDPIVAGDFVYSWKRLIDPRNAAGYSYVMADVVEGTELLGVDVKTTSDADINAMMDKFGVSAPDDKTFVVKLAHPAAYFVYIATLYGTVPLEEKWVNTPDFTEAANFVASGPMMMKEWQHNSKITLVPNPNWNPDISKDFGGAPTIKEVDYAMITDPSASLAAYEAGELDIAGVPSQEVSRIQSDPTLSQQVLSGATLSITYFGFDVKQAKSPFTKSINLRHAFNEAIDKKTMMATAFSGIGVVANSLVPPGMPGHQDFDYYPFDLTKAKADFDAGLKDLGLTDASQLKLQIGYNTGANWENKVDFMVEAWRTAFGVTVEPVGLEWGAYLDRLSKDPFTIFRLGWGADYPHPNNFLTDLISCTSANNNMGYCNKDVDALLAQAATKSTLEEQVPLYNQAQEMVMKDAPIIPVRFGQRFGLVKPYVLDLNPTAQDSQISGENFFAWVQIAAH
jgi:oligopeptide transport system substrate-binding protein